MARCKKCPTILRSGNNTGYCSICEPPPPNERKIKTLFFSYAEGGEKKQWDRFLLNIDTRVAVAFSVTIKTLEQKDASAETDGHLAVYLLLTELFHISAKHISRYMKISPYQLEAALQKAGESYCDDGVFQRQYCEARDRLLSIERDILPRCADPADLLVQQETEEFKPYVRFVQTVGKPAGSIRTGIAS